MGETRVVGRRVSSVDALEKVTGRAVYGVDVQLPNMLHAKILRSPFPHARILSIETSRAAAIPGVRLVATAEDAPKTRFGVAYQDERLFAEDEAHYVGDEIAAVVAVDEETAAKAIRLIDVKYKELRAILDPLEALKPDSPLVRSDVSSNVAHHTELHRGDLRLGFEQAAIIRERTYRTSHQYHAYLEPMAAAAQWRGNNLTIWAPHQSSGPLSRVICQGFELPISQFRFIQTQVGGGFGGKSHMRVCSFAALLARLAGQPVRIVLDREEDFMSGSPRVPMIIKLKMGVDAQGLITAKDMQIVADNGAFSSFAPSIADVAATRVDTLYRFKNLHARVDLVYTNKLGTGPFRGYGNVQGHFAVESMMDDLAEDLGMDPADIRLRNATQPGDVSAHGWEVGSCGLSESIRKATQAVDWSERKRGGSSEKPRGIGMACGIHVASNRALSPPGDGSSSFVRVNPDGTVHVMCSEGGLGQGSKTVYCQIAAEILGVPMEVVSFGQLDTEFISFGVGCIASRGTVLGGNAVRAGALEARRRLKTAAADKWACSEDDILYSEGRLINTQSEEEMSMADAAAHYMGITGGSRLIGEGIFCAEGVVVPDETKYGNISIAYSFATHVAEVEVDLETGQVNVLRLVAAHDAGRVINPLGAEGQIEGGMVQGLGQALMEDYIFENGVMMNACLADYLIPTVLDVPRVEVFFVDVEEPKGPYGAKSLGELAMVPTAAAIANAIYDATGIRMAELPMTPERILRRLKERRENPRGSA